MTEWMCVTVKTTTCMCDANLFLSITLVFLCSVNFNFILYALSLLFLFRHQCRPWGQIKLSCIILPSFSQKWKHNLRLTLTNYIHSDIVCQEMTGQPRWEHCVLAWAWRGGDVGGVDGFVAGWTRGIREGSREGHLPEYSCTHHDMLYPSASLPPRCHMQTLMHTLASHMH